MAQTPKEKGLEQINMNSIKGTVNYLASDWMEGRETGEKGAFMASAYIASLMEIYGLQPVSGEDFYHTFPLIRYDKSDKQRLSIIRKGKNFKERIKFDYQTDFSIYKGNTGSNFEAPVVFAGYGITDEEKGYNDLKGIDIKNKIVVIIEDLPGHDDENSKAAELFKSESPRQYWSMRRNYTNKLREQEPLAILTIGSKSSSMRWAKNSFHYQYEQYEFDKKPEMFQGKSYSLQGSEYKDRIASITISQRVADAILKDTGISIEQYEKDQANNPKGFSKELKDVKINVSYNVNSEIIKGRNVAGILKGKDTTKYVVVGAHFDHLGKKDGYIFNGADDNASGVAGMLTMAKAFASSGQKPAKNIVFVAFTGEEKGLLGSHQFAKDYKDLNIDYMLNLDMISRDGDKDSLHNQCAVIYTKGRDDIRKSMNTQLEETGLNIDFLYWPSSRNGGSDHAAFGKQGIPVAFFWTGWHDDYHQPSDETDKLNWEKCLNVTKLGYLNIWDVVENNAIVK